MRILSGTQPTGDPHIGNYFGAFRQYIELAENNEAYFFIANYHALTSINDPKVVEENTQKVAMTYLALGLDPDKTALFKQSSVPEVCELSWVLSCLIGVGKMERMTTYKDKIARGLSANLGLFSYPVLQAADILIYRSEKVPIGQDQKQHLEISRDLANHFNELYGETLIEPEPYIIDTTAVVPGTDGQKMSKSYSNTIQLFGTDKQAKKSIMGIKTDSTPRGAPLNPDTCTVFQLYSLFAADGEKEQMKKDYLAGAVGYGDAKKMLLEKFHLKFDGARERYAELEKNPDEVEKALEAGGKRARAKAQEVMVDVRKAVGV